LRHVGFEKKAGLPHRIDKPMFERCVRAGAVLSVGRRG
jgi:hypothetical protein